MEIGAAEYRKASEEHLSGAIHCHLNGDYLTCHYLCGLAVECILLAYRWKIDSSWNGRHALPKLYKEARFDGLVRDKESSDMAVKFLAITSRRSNTHRYTSPAKLEKFLNERGATRNLKRNKLKANASEMLSAADFIVKIGINKWNN